MNRLLYFGCTPGSDVASLQNDLNLITGHTQQGSSMAALEVDGVFGAKSQSRVMEFQRINGLTVDGVAGEQTRSKLDELFSSEPGLQIKRIRGGVAGSEGDATGVKTGGGAFGKMPPAGTGAAKGGGTTVGQGGWGKGGSGYGSAKTAGTGGGGQGKATSTYGYKG
ncbi:MAG: peptidoglycan-binding protein [Deltaproteobacteria bacterium]|nr:peptidoglycan-binding protein [Deltaproteobacteria bacterium]